MFQSAFFLFKNKYVV